MGLNIKNASTEAAIRELAERTGQSLTGAVEAAVLEKLSLLKSRTVPDTVTSMMDRLRPLQEALAAKRLDPDDKRSARKWIEDLYDEHGLPK